METYKGLEDAGKHVINIEELATIQSEDRKCTNYAGLKVSGEELNTYENWKHMGVMLT